MHSFRSVLVVIGLALTSAAASAQDVSSWARVLEDGSLSISGRHVRLQGVSIPPSDRLCGQPDMPATCAPRAVLQLIRKVGAEFVRCQDLGRDAGGAMLGRCSVLGEDLGGWMILNGWAMAGIEAPFEYVQWERLAERRGLGLWGRPVDNVIVRPAPRPQPVPTLPVVPPKKAGS